MADIWSFSFRTQLDPDSDDSDNDDRDEEGEATAGGEDQEAGREDEELALLDLGGRADEAGLVVQKTPWTIAKSNARPKNIPGPQLKDRAKKSVPAASEASSSSRPTLESSASSHPPVTDSTKKQRSATSESHSAASSSSSKRSARPSKSKIEVHTPAHLKPVARKKSQGEAAGSKPKRKKSAAEANENGASNKSNAPAGKISFGKIPAGATADSAFPILQAFEHQAKTKPHRERAPSPPPPPPPRRPETSPRAQAVVQPTTSSRVQSSGISTPRRTLPLAPLALPHTPLNGSPQDQPFASPHTRTPLGSRALPISVVSSSPASSSDTFRQPARVDRPVQPSSDPSKRVETRAFVPPAAAHTTTVDLDDDEPFSTQLLHARVPVRRVSISPPRPASPEARWTYGEDEQPQDEDQLSTSASWNQPTVYEQRGMVQRKRKLGSTKPTPGWTGAEDASEQSSSSFSSKSGKRRFKPLVPVGGRSLPALASQPQPPPSPPPRPKQRRTLNPPPTISRQLRPASPARASPLAYYDAPDRDLPPAPAPRTSAYQHPAFDHSSDRHSSPPVWSTLPPPKKRKKQNDLEGGGITDLGRFRLPAFLPQQHRPSPPPSPPRYRRPPPRAPVPAQAVATASLNPSGSSSSTIVDSSGRRLTLWIPPPPPPAPALPTRAASPTFAYAPPSAPMRRLKPSGQPLAPQISENDEDGDAFNSPPQQPSFHPSPPSHGPSQQSIQNLQQYHYSHHFPAPPQPPSSERDFW